MKYAIKFQKYSPKNVLVIPNLEWSTALLIAEKISKNLHAWTRHESCTDLVLHMDNYQDLYNEGSVIITRQTSENLARWDIKQSMTNERLEIN